MPGGTDRYFRVRVYSSEWYVLIILQVEDGEHEFSFMSSGKGHIFKAIDSIWGHIAGQFYEDYTVPQPELTISFIGAGAGIIPADDAFLDKEIASFLK